MYIEVYEENTEASWCQVRKIWLHHGHDEVPLPHSLRSYFAIVFANALNGGRFLFDLLVADPVGKGISRCGPLNPSSGILIKILNSSLSKTLSSGKI